MAAITWLDVGALAPELASLPESATSRILAHVNTALNVTALGGEDSPRLRLARIYLAAHYATISTTGGSLPAGPVTSEAVDGLSRSYASMFTAGASMGPWSSTAYGQAFAATIRSTSSLRLPVVA